MPASTEAIVSSPSLPPTGVPTERASSGARAISNPPSDPFAGAVEMKSMPSRLTRGAALGDAPEGFHSSSTVQAASDPPARSIAVSDPDAAAAYSVTTASPTPRTTASKGAAGAGSSAPRGAPTSMAPSSANVTSRQVAAASEASARRAQKYAWPRTVVGASGIRRHEEPSTAASGDAPRSSRPSAEAQSSETVPDASPTTHAPSASSQPAGTS